MGRLPSELRAERRRKNMKKRHRGMEEDVGRKWKQTDSFNEETPLSFASTQILSKRISVEEGKTSKES